MPDNLPAPPLRLDLDSDALAANWRALNRLSGQARAGAAVKADAYGLGARRVVPVLAQAGCDTFFVAHWAEAAELLDLIPAERIAVLHGRLSLADAAFARDTGLRPVINSLLQARIWQEANGGLCHLMVDTGINRLGLPMDELGDPTVAGLQVDLLLSHLASAEEEDNPQNPRQQALWIEARGQIAHARASLANSAGIALGPDYHGDLTRPGIALYGGVPCAALAPHIAQVAKPAAQLMQVRDLLPGDSVGWSGKGTMRSDGAELPVLGRVSMDMTVIDLSHAPGVAEGDWIALDYALPEAAAQSDLSQYELLTLLGRRFPR
jgi:alanine racemase